MDVGAGLEAALHMEGVGVGVEQIAALLGAGGHHLHLLLRFIYGDSLKTRSAERKLSMRITKSQSI